MQINRFHLWLFVIIVISLIIYKLFSPGDSPYNYFTRLAIAFSQGQLYLTENPAWLNELIPLDGKYFVVYPPMPAIILLPMVFWGGAVISQTLFSIILGSIDVGLVFVLLKRMKQSTMTCVLVSLFFGFGTNHFYLSTIGSAWYMAHLVATFFMLLALIETYGKQRLLLIGLLIGASFWSRSTVILGLPFFLIVMWHKFWPLNASKIRNLLLLGLGLITFLGFDIAYNFARFGSLSPISPYDFIPDSEKGREFQNGFVSWRFIPRQLEGMFLSLPVLIDRWPYVIPSIYSLAIWFTSPAILLAFKAKKSAAMLGAWASVFSIFLVLSMWAGVGYSQFGYRFAQDFMPFLLILVSLGIGPRPQWLAYLLVTLSVLVNFWGVIMINIFKIWSW